MKRKRQHDVAEPVEPLIHVLRGERIILDVDLARIYGVPTKRLNEQGKRNLDRFPPDFQFQITWSEFDALRPQIATLNAADNRLPEATDPKGNLKSQIATSSSGHGGRRKLPFAFTEHGAIMAVNVLNSRQAVQMSVFVVRAFVKMRAVLSDNRQLARKLAELEKELKDRLSLHEAAIVEVLQRVTDILDPPSQPEPKRRQIGFHAGGEQKTERGTVPREIKDTGGES
jgi:phage regulator Rha-like protein